MKTMTGTERSHLGALLRYQAAIRANDLVKAERWLRCAERCYRLTEHARRDAEQWKQFKRRVADVEAEERRRVEENRRFARQLRAAAHRKRLSAIADTPPPS